MWYIQKKTTKGWATIGAESNFIRRWWFCRKYLKKKPKCLLRWYKVKTH